jgi:hypothetical protein
MIGKVLGWASSAASPWMWAISGIVTAVLLAIVAAGFLYVQTLQDRLVSAQTALGVAKVQIVLLQKSLDDAVKAAEESATRFEELAEDRAEDNSNWQKLFDDILALDSCAEPPVELPGTDGPTPPVEGTTDEKPKGTLADSVTRINDDLNRMLNEVTRYRD